MIDHNHWHQVRHGVLGCPACERIDHIHMTRDYAIWAWLKTQRESAEADSI